LPSLTLSGGPQPAFREQTPLYAFSDRVGEYPFLSVRPLWLFGETVGAHRFVDLGRKASASFSNITFVGMNTSARSSWVFEGVGGDRWGLESGNEKGQNR
jgi:hypothetical protein